MCNKKTSICWMWRLFQTANGQKRKVQPYHTSTFYLFIYVRLHVKAISAFTCVAVSAVGILATCSPLQVPKWTISTYSITLSIVNSYQALAHGCLKAPYFQFIASLYTSDWFYYKESKKFPRSHMFALKIVLLSVWKKQFVDQYIFIDSLTWQYLIREQYWPMMKTMVHPWLY